MARERLLAELMEAAGLPDALRSDADWSRLAVSSVTSDSRAVRPGGCFVAVSGGSADGHSYIDAALRGGAIAVVSERRTDVPIGVGAIQVRDARTALARLAAAFFGFAPGQVHECMKLVGVTGTNGKTTTTTLIQAILRASGHPTALLGTIEYDLVGEKKPAPWTTPPPVELYESLATAASHGATHAVMEVSSHALAQSRCDGHRFAAGVFTNLTGDHLDYHKDWTAYAAAKKKLFDMLSADAVAVVNSDDATADYMVRDCRASVLRFGLTSDADVIGVIESADVLGTDFVLRTSRGATRVRLALTGRHNVSNALAAAATAMGLGLSLDDARRGLESVAMVPGRLQRVDAKELGFSIFVDYAHTDDALLNVLTTLRPLTKGRLICVFGCGGNRDRTKRPRMAAAAADHADLAIVTSDNPRWEEPDAIIEEILTGFSVEERRWVHVERDRMRAIEYAVGIARADDAILIAGKGHEDYQIVRDVRLHFDDVEAAGGAVERLRGVRQR